MAPLTSWDIIIGLAAIAVAAFSIYMFIRASNGSFKEKRKEPIRDIESEFTSSFRISPPIRDRNLRVPGVDRHLRPSEIQKARSEIRTLTLQSELLSMMLKRLFEAEDEGEITREERLSLSKGYESDLKRISERLKRAELIATLHELEIVREDILKKYEATLNSTQSRIDSILKELGMEKRRERVERAPRRIQPPEEEEETPEEAEEEKPRARRPRSDVETRLEQLRSEVLKELEELDKLELEA